MKRVLTAVMAVMLIGALAPAGQAGPSAGGLSTDNLEYVTSIRGKVRR